MIRRPAGTQKNVRFDPPTVPSCAEPDCNREVAVVVYVPWGEDRPVCAPHGRVLGRQDGVVAEPIADADEWR